MPDRDRDRGRRRRGARPGGRRSAGRGPLARRVGARRARPGGRRVAAGALLRAVGSQSSGRTALNGAPGRFGHSPRSIRSRRPGSRPDAGAETPARRSATEGARSSSPFVALGRTTGRGRRRRGRRRRGRRGRGRRRLAADERDGVSRCDGRPGRDGRPVARLRAVAGRRGRRGASVTTAWPSDHRVRAVRPTISRASGTWRRWTDRVPPVDRVTYGPVASRTAARCPAHAPMTWPPTTATSWMLQATAPGSQPVAGSNSPTPSRSQPCPSGSLSARTIRWPSNRMNVR